MADHIAFGIAGQIEDDGKISAAKPLSLVTFTASAVFCARKQRFKAGGGNDADMILRIDPKTFCVLSVIPPSENLEGQADLFPEGDKE